MKTWSLENLKSLKDGQLLLLLAEGERLALDVFFQRHSGKVVNYGLKHRLSKEQSQDLVQIVFLQLFRKKHLYDPQHEALAWLYVITRSECKDYLKKERKNTSLSLENVSQKASEDPIHPEAQEASEETAALLGTLPAPMREVVKMRYLEDMEFQEISRKLQQSESNVRQILSRALKRLRAHAVPKKGENT